MKAVCTPLLTCFYSMSLVVKHFALLGCDAYPVHFLAVQADQKVFCNSFLSEDMQGLIVVM